MPQTLFCSNPSTMPHTATGSRRGEQCCAEACGLTHRPPTTRTKPTTSGLNWATRRANEDSRLTSNSGHHHMPPSAPKTRHWGVMKAARRVMPNPTGPSGAPSGRGRRRRPSQGALPPPGRGQYARGGRAASERSLVGRENLDVLRSRESARRGRGARRRYEKGPGPRRRGPTRVVGLGEEHRLDGPSRSSSVRNFM